ncbi:serine protease [Mycobacterium simiae]|uniref:Serine protease n=1 Tax=Mycobacterium simiae TaxID=1784 RepID=A0A5B1B806_MYCSI|nr:serine protease [Mycobacterium simiae]
MLAAVLAAAALAAAPPATADAGTVSPGDRVDYVNPDGSAQFCTIGHVYTGPDLHTYAVTAGHCRTTAGGYARDTTTGVSGAFIRAVTVPPRTGGPDYGLIDFGLASLPVSFIGELPAIPDRREPRPGQRVCFTGVSSGRHCGGQIVAVHGSDQYLTTGLPAGVPGDSGGPVWIQEDRGRAARIIGIWLGQKITGGGAEYGRFASLAEGLRLLGAA